MNAHAGSPADAGHFLKAVGWEDIVPRIVKEAGLLPEVYSAA